MVKVYSLNDTATEKFKEMFTSYYEELGCDDNCEHLLNEYVLCDLLAGLLYIDIIEEDGKVAGFVIYQKDEIDNDWNFSEGWGDIRELYISPLFRERGLGKFLLYTAEFKLKEKGITKTYCLPSENSIPFFLACGYEESDKYCDDLDCNAWIKTDLNNGCGK
jgi:GNAT superfamily N-acetyltransferase